MDPLPAEAAAASFYDRLQSIFISRGYSHLPREEDGAVILYRDFGISYLVTTKGKYNEFLIEEDDGSEAYYVHRGDDSFFKKVVAADGSKIEEEIDGESLCAKVQERIERYEAILKNLKLNLKINENTDCFHYLLDLLAKKCGKSERMSFSAEIQLILAISELAWRLDTDEEKDDNDVALREFFEKLAPLIELSPVKTLAYLEFGVSLEELEGDSEIWREKIEWLKDTTTEQAETILSGDFMRWQIKLVTSGVSLDRAITTIEKNSDRKWNAFFEEYELQRSANPAEPANTIFDRIYLSFDDLTADSPSPVASEARGSRASSVDRSSPEISV